MKQFTTLIVLCFILISTTAQSANLVQVIRFSDYETGSEEDWLLGKGFQFKQDARRRDLIDLEVTNGTLTIDRKSVG